MFTRRVPKGTTHIPYLFDFVSNCGYFDPLLSQLDQDFVVNRVNIIHCFNT